MPMRHQGVEEPLVAAQQALDASCGETANFGRLKSDGRVLVHLGLHAFQPENVGLSQKANDPLVAVGEIVRQLYESCANGEKRDAFFASPVDRRACRVIQLIDGPVNLIEIPLLQSGEEDRLSDVAGEAVGNARPSLGVCNWVQCRSLSRVVTPRTTRGRLIVWRSLSIRNDAKS